MPSLLLIAFSYIVIKINAISDYTLVNVAAPGLTSSEANDYCVREYGTALATINTQSDYDSARVISINGNPTNGNLKLKNAGGSSEWWYAVKLLDLPDGYQVGKFEVTLDGGWLNCDISQIEHWAIQCVRANEDPTFNLPLSVRITAVNGEEIEVNDVILSYDDGVEWDLEKTFGYPIEEPWIGMRNTQRAQDAPFFAWLSDDACSEAAHGACVPASFWVNNEPINCNEKGTDCVIFYSDGFNNDRECDTRRRTFLCDRDAVPAAHIVYGGELKTFSANESYFGGISNWALILGILALSVMCNMIYTIYCLFAKWCKNRNEEEHKRYNVIGNEDEVEAINDV